MIRNNPCVHPQLETDLAPSSRITSVRWKDGSGQEHALTNVQPEYRLYLVGREGEERYSVPLNWVTEIAVNDEHTRWGPKDLEPTREVHVVSHWRRTEWGELVRFGLG